MHEVTHVGAIVLLVPAPSPLPCSSNKLSERLRVPRQLFLLAAALALGHLAEARRCALDS